MILFFMFWALPLFCSIYALNSRSDDYRRQPERNKLRLWPAPKFYANWNGLIGLVIELIQLNAGTFGFDISWDKKNRFLAPFTYFLNLYQEAFSFLTITAEVTFAFLATVTFGWFVLLKAG